MNGLTGFKFVLISGQPVMISAYHFKRLIQDGATCSKCGNPAKAHPNEKPCLEAYLVATALPRRKRGQGRKKKVLTSEQEQVRAEQKKHTRLERYKRTYKAPENYRGHLTTHETEEDFEVNMMDRYRLHLPKGWLPRLLMKERLHGFRLW